MQQGFLSSRFALREQLQAFARPPRVEEEDEEAAEPDRESRSANRSAPSRAPLLKVAL